jgi:hypothetical protein
MPTRARSTLGACCEAAAQPESTFTRADPLQRLCPLGLLAANEDEPGPDRSEPVVPPELVLPEPEVPVPGVLEPDEPVPEVPEPVVPGVVVPELMEPGVVVPEPVVPGVVVPGAVVPGAVVPGVVAPGVVVPEPIEPEFVLPVPDEPEPIEPDPEVLLSVLPEPVLEPVLLGPIEPELVVPEPVVLRSMLEPVLPDPIVLELDPVLPDPIVLELEPEEPEPMLDPDAAVPAVPAVPVVPDPLLPVPRVVEPGPAAEPVPFDVVDSVPAQPAVASRAAQMPVMAHLVCLMMKSFDPLVNGRDQSRPMCGAATAVPMCGISHAGTSLAATGTSPFLHRRHVGDSLHLDATGRTPLASCRCLRRRLPVVRKPLQRTCGGAGAPAHRRRLPRAQHGDRQPVADE